MMKKLLVILILLIVNPAWGGVNFSTDDSIPLSDFDPTTFTTSAWLTVTSFPSSGNLQEALGKGYDGTIEGYSMRLYNDSGTQKVQCNSFSGTDRIVSWSHTGWSTGTWHHLACTCSTSDNVWRLYFDGVLKATSAAQSSCALGNTYSYIIGAMTNIGTTDRFWNGIISDVAMWNVKLTDNEILQIASSRLKRIPLQFYPSNLLFYHPLDQLSDGVSGDGITFIDMSASARNGTGSDGANNTGLTSVAGTLTYP